jgi:hypothetical protein
MGVQRDASDDDTAARIARELACELSRDISRPRHPRRELARRTVLGVVAGISTPHPPVATGSLIAAAIAAIMTDAAKRFDHCSRRARSCVATDADRRDAPVHGRDAGRAVRCQEGTAGAPMRHHRLRAPVQCDEGPHKLRMCLSRTICPDPELPRVRNRGRAALPTADRRAIRAVATPACAGDAKRNGLPSRRAVVSAGKYWLYALRCLMRVL